MKPSNGIIGAWNEHIIKEYLYNKASPSVSALNSLSEIITTKPNIVYQNLLDMSNNEEYVGFLAKAQKPLTPKSTPKPLEETKEDIKKKLRKTAENPYNLFSNIPNSPSELLFNDFLDIYKYRNPNANISSSEYSKEIATYILTKFINCQHTIFTLSPISFDFHYPYAEATDLKK
ncbi:MAG: hypothetical protein LBM93_15245 [Oscillospiraceae bacterium]|jgi:hypothetical protein|nr:hypothetical protein [Oscillospiraceae bacterium]